MAGAKKYAHPLEDTTLDLYPLHERNTVTNFLTTKEGEGFDEQVIGKANTAGISSHGEADRRRICKTTDFDVHSESQ